MYFIQQHKKFYDFFRGLFGIDAKNPPGIHDSVFDYLTIKIDEDFLFQTSNVTQRNPIIFLPGFL